MTRIRIIDTEGTIDESNQSSRTNELSETSWGDSPSPKLKSFFEIVRPGCNPERAKVFMAKEVRAHQMNSENMVK
jgi:hypothetical protein